MEFKTMVMGEADIKYKNMSEDKTPNPLTENILVSESTPYRDKRNKYVNRLEREKSEYNSARKTVLNNRSNRLAREESARQAKEKKRERNRYILAQTIKTIVVLLPAMILLLWGAIMNISPLVAFRFLHFGWIIPIFIVCCIVYFIVAKKAKKKHIKVLSIMASICFISLMVVGMIRVPQTIEISNVFEFEAIGNLPGAGSRNYTLKSDIDFDGKTSKSWGKIKEFKGIFDGNHFSICNLVINAESKKLDCGTIYISEQGESNQSSDVYGLGFVQKNRGEIKNTRFDNIKIISNSKANQFVGVVAAYNSGKITNCLITDCSIKIQGSSENLCYVGGVVGYDNSGEIHNVAFINNKDSLVFDVSSKKSYLGGIAGESYAADTQDVFVYQKNKNNDRTGGVIGVAEALWGGWYGTSQKYYLTNCINCFAPSHIFAYGDSVSLAGEETQVYTKERPIVNSEDLPEMPELLTEWQYSREFGYYLPCYNFD